MHPPAQRAVRRVTAAVAVACLVLLAAACIGGGSDTPSVTLALRADLSGLPPSVDTVQVMKGVAEALKARADSFGVLSADIVPDEDRMLTARLNGIISPDEARQLMGGRGVLDLREPKRDEAGNVVCTDGEGSEFAVAPGQLKYEPVESDERLFPRCPIDGKPVGEIVWSGITATVPEGQEPAPAKIQQSGANVDTTGEAVVIIALTTEGKVDLEEISKGLIGLPLAIFLDGEMLAAPTISEPVTAGVLPIPGLGSRGAKLLAARIGPGPLPVPVEIVSVEQD
jgi:preprotein translocase subunit SecD